MTETKFVATACPTRRSFTLVELLVVIAIMGILMFIGLPAFEKLAKGSGVELGSRNLTSKIGQARGYAITKREFVAVLMPTAATTPKLPNDYIFKSYKLCVVSSIYTAGTPNNFTFKSWIPSENWSFLQTGNAINDISSTAHAVGSDSDWATALLDVVNDVSLKEFNNPPTATTYNAVDNVRAIVFKPTGKMVVSGNRHVAVSESTYNGTGATLTNTNKKNWIDVIIDQFTGRVTYGSE
ncbi:MAG TPA: hypothetical protein DET40_14965 [Lentisphaeria bacterium]|nr:MAG: hypothetical protein A2X45_13310 [Lentisphaerae bacterium GWF2_50_93]HCE44839.1 hypothetical protein [Lentisphaeria bacterium]